MMSKRTKAQFGPPGKLWFAPAPVQAGKVQKATAQQFPRLQQPEDVAVDQQAQPVSQPAPAKES